jgi:hypothetical protein
MANSLRRLTGLTLTTLLTGLLLTPNGCMPVPGTAVAVRFSDSATATQSRTVTVQVMTPMRTQVLPAVTAGTVHHYTFRLWTWNGSTLGTMVASGDKVTASPSFSASFSNVPDDTYKITVQAYSNAAGTIPGSAETPSSNAVTVTGGAVSGSPLLVSLNLNDAQPNQIHPVITAIPGHISADGHLAPNDSTSSMSPHNYTVTIGGKTSTFVWIPHFTAYQLMLPTTAGYPTKMPGTWVTSQPSGTADVAWRKGDFGGFYVGKYEASHDTASGTSAGSGTTLAVQANVVPWTDVTWDEAAMACLTFPNGHLMTDEEWTALAVYTQIYGIAVRGNNGNNGTVAWDVDDNTVTFTDDPTENGTGPGRALTGSGGVKTSHTGTADGVYDLNGNVAEWTATLSKDNANSNWVVDGQHSTLPMSTANAYVNGTVIDPLVFRLGVPALGATNAEFGNDRATFNSDTTDKRMIRGGSWVLGTDAGLWSMDGTLARTATNPAVGFRPCLRF